MIPRIDERDRILSPAEVVAKTSLSRSTIWRMSKRSEFPPPTKLSPGRIGWSLSTISRWLADREAEAA